SVKFQDYKLNFIDAPGSAEFLGEIRAAIQVIDGAVIVFDSEAVVQIETVKHYKLCEDKSIPRIFFINKIDKENANFEKALTILQETFGKPIVPIVIPIIENKKIIGYIDILFKKAYLKEQDSFKESSIPDNKKDDVNKIFEKLMEAVAEGEDSYIEKVLSGESLTDEEILDGFSKTVSQGKFIPVLCGSTIDNGGILPLLNAICKAFPSYISKKTFKGINKSDNKEVEINISENGPFCGFCFKTVIDQFNGRLSFIKILQGELKKDDDVVIIEKNNKFKVTKILQPFGNKVEEIEKGATGDIVVLQKIDDISTTLTLGSKDISYTYAYDRLPQPVYSVAISTKDKNTEDKLISTLHKFSEEDPTLNVRFDAETKQNVVSGMGELHLEVYFSKIRKQLKIDFETSIPRINYKETITKQVESRYKHKKQSGGHGQYGEVAIRVSPNKRGEGFKFINSIVGGVIPKQYIPGVEKGLIEGLNNGVLGKFPIIDIIVELFDGSYHEVDSSEMSFKIAARQALKDAMTKGDPILLEPIMTLSVYAMDKYTGDIISDLNGKRGKILGMDPIPGGLTLIKAEVPHSELLRYATDLKSITQGTASFELEFSHYSPLTGKLAEQVIEERKKFISAEEEE
ncbi:MAG: elongation factor G, partial [Exilispira sp.]